MEQLSILSYPSLTPLFAPVLFDYANKGDFYDVDFNDDGKFVSPPLSSLSSILSALHCVEGSLGRKLTSPAHLSQTARRHHLNLHPHLLSRPPSVFFRLRETFLLLLPLHSSPRSQGDQEDTSRLSQDPGGSHLSSCSVRFPLPSLPHSRVASLSFLLVVLLPY